MSTTQVPGRRANVPRRAHHLARGGEMAKRTEAERFWAKVDCSGGPDACWPWLGFVRPNGYGLASNGRSSMQANRKAWVLTYGPIAAGLDIDHQCHNRDATCSGGDGCGHRRCCNPRHLEPATRLENVRRRSGGLVLSPDRCLRGHDLGVTLYLSPDGRRHCMECARQSQRGYRSRNGARIAMANRARRLRK